MSKIGKQPIKLPEGVNVEVSKKAISVTGPKGTLARDLPRGIVVVKREGQLEVVNKRKTTRSRAMHGTTRAHISNMVKGVSVGWTKILEIVGAGYKTEVSGKTLVLNVGFSHSVEIEIPEGISVRTEKTEITIEGIDRELVGHFAAKVRSVRPPEPYKGKGIRYKDEEVRRKPGKAAKTQGVQA